MQYHISFLHKEKCTKRVAGMYTPVREYTPDEVLAQGFYPCDNTRTIRCKKGADYSASTVS